MINEKEDFRNDPVINQILNEVEKGQISADDAQDRISDYLENQSPKEQPSAERLSEEKVLEILLTKVWVDNILNTKFHLKNVAKQICQLSIQQPEGAKEEAIKTKCKHNASTFYSPDTGLICSDCKQKLISIYMTEQEVKQLKASDKCSDQNTSELKAEIERLNKQLRQEIECVEHMKEVCDNYEKDLQQLKSKGAEEQIVLPTDEEINIIAQNRSDVMDINNYDLASIRSGVKYGAKWMRDLIQEQLNKLKKD